MASTVTVYTRKANSKRAWIPSPRPRVANPRGRWLSPTLACASCSTKETVRCLVIFSSVAGYQLLMTARIKRGNEWGSNLLRCDLSVVRTTNRYSSLITKTFHLQAQTPVRITWCVTIQIKADNQCFQVVLKFQSSKVWPLSSTFLWYIVLYCNRCF